METPRDIRLKISLAGGVEHEVALQEDAPELLALYTALGRPEEKSRLIQLPLEGGTVACSFQTSKIVSIVSSPPVVIPQETEKVAQPGRVPPPERASGSPSLRRPRYVVIDDFLNQHEHDELLAYALISEEHFQAGTVASYEPDVRQNQVILNFGDSVHSRLFENRLLIWFPLLAKTLGMNVFPLNQIESQLTAAGDGYYFKTHTDHAPDVPRTLTCVYYLHREPRGFSGGELRLYDAIGDGSAWRAAETFSPVGPIANRLVVFPSEEFHEAMPVRCPSKEFADSRFAVTTWLHRAEQLDPTATFGWGHFRCGVVAPQFAGFEKSEAMKS